MIGSLFQKACLAAAGGALLAGGISARAEDLKSHGPIAWKTTLEEAKKIAAKEKKPILIDFGATWCGPCKQMLKTTYVDKDVVARARQFVALYVDYDHDNGLVTKYHVPMVPTVVFLDSTGKLIKRTESKYIPAKDFVKIMDEVSKKK